MKNSILFLKSFVALPYPFKCARMQGEMPSANKAELIHQANLYSIILRRQLQNGAS